MTKQVISYLPEDFANVFKVLELNSKMIIYSDFTAEESLYNDYRSDQNLWLNWNKKK